MKKRLICLTLCLTMVFSLGSYAFADDSADLVQVNAAADSLAAADEAYYLLNGTAVTDPSLTVINGTTYVSLQSVIETYPEGTIVWPNSKALATVNGLSMTVGVGDKYIEANNRSLSVPDGVQYINGRVALPIRVMAKALGGEVYWDNESGICAMTTGTPILNGNSFYNYEDLYWLSHIINAESGGESLNGKLAVGTVILNRVASPQFPNTIYDVVFDRRSGVWQFTPAGTGAVNRTPNAESITAAKLCLEGARVGGSSLYFVNLSVSPNCWASRNRPYVATIGHHTFFA
ncbi:MAG: copper amine oxidase [Clostridia bacterium]|nr:copper amine oxidase [Clostridia bacterium]